MTSGDPVTYTIMDGPSPLAGQIRDSETGQGIATFSGGLWGLTRNVRVSTNDNMPIVCTGKQIVGLSLGAEDLSLTGAVGTITGVLSSDGQLSAPIPAGAVITGGKIAANTSARVTVSLGSTVGASDILLPISVPGAPDPGVPIQGINFDAQIFANDQPVFVHSAAWGGALVTITIWYLGQ